MTRSADESLAFRDRRWWQNWGKTHSYIAQRMMFPTTVNQIGAAIRMAEREDVPVRAVGGGWSFSDVYLPDGVTSGRPYPLGVETIAALVPLVKTFPGGPVAAAIAEAGPVPDDGRRDLEMFDGKNTEPNNIDTRWEYRGAGVWELAHSNRYHDALLRGLPTDGSIDGGTHRFTDLRGVAPHGFRPIQRLGEDGPGTLAMFDDATNAFLTTVFYNGGGWWTLNPFDREAKRLTLPELFRELPATVRIRQSTPPLVMSQLLPGPQRAFLINTFSLASSLQQQLPEILSEQARAATSPDRLGRPRHYFHVEAGITMEALSMLLQHQHPRLAMEATGGSPGATLAGALATATHGGEHKSPLLVDRVKAVHLVGPGGLQWWIEGDDSVADPEDLLRVYPCLSRERILQGTEPVGGLRPQDWLNAVVVSMGSMGVIYSMVLEVVPLFGIHEVVVQKRWRRLLRDAARTTPEELRDTTRPLATRQALGQTILDYLGNGLLNRTAIHPDRNEYIDLAIDPNRIPSDPDMIPGADYNCWIVNRERTDSVPFEAKPVPRDMLGRVAKSLGEAFRSEAVADRLADDFDLEFIRELQSRDVARNIGGVFHALGSIGSVADRAGRMLARLTSSPDMIDTILDLLTGPIGAANDAIGARAIVSSFFAGLLGVEDERAEATDSASKVGAIGFPASGIMGAAIEVAMAPADAFEFLQTEILDHVRQPFFGYISVRVCPQTNALLGMQQFSPSVMIELVAFATRSARNFVVGVQKRTVDRIREGTLEAMLHWGLENVLLEDEALRRIRPISTGSPSKIDKFKTVRSRLKDAAPSSPRVFDNAFTRRLDL